MTQLYSNHSMILQSVVEMRAIDGQLDEMDEMNAACGPRQPLAKLFTFVIRSVVPDHTDGLFVPVLRLDFLQKRD